MATTYSWIIDQLDCYPQHQGYTAVVSTIHWRRQAVDGVYKADMCNSQTLSLNADLPFTPYEQLTKLQVEKWLVDAIGADKVAQIDASLSRQIADQKNPPIVRPALPWA